MADDAVTLPGTGADIAVDRIAGDDYQLIKLVDATEDSLERTGVDANPLTTEARLAFVDWDDSIVPVTDNADHHFLPVSVRGTSSVSVEAFNTSVPVTGVEGSSELTGPSNGTWITDFDASTGRPGMLRLTVRSTGGTPTIGVFGAATTAGAGGTFDQGLPLIVPDGDSLVLAETFTPGVGARFCYILAPAPVIEIRAVSGGTGTAVDATLTTSAFQPPIVATVRSGAQPVTDNGGSLTVDGTVGISGTVAVTDNSGSLTVDGTVAATQSGTWNVGTVTTVTNVVHVDDNSGSLTTDDNHAEDAGHNSGDAGSFVLAVRQSEANSLTSSAGSDGDYAALNGDARGLLQVVARPYVSRIRVASSGLTTSVTAYSVGDTAGVIMTFAGCARVSGGTGTILAATLLDKGDVGVDYRLHIYRSSVTLNTDNLAWAVSDADQQELIGIVTLPSMLDVGANRVTTLSNIGLPYDCAATSLFVGIETRSANAFYAAATDLNLILTVALD